MSKTVETRRGLKLHNIQALRAIAAQFVVLAHALWVTGRWDVHSDFISGLDGILALLGVWMFFVISGFIMLHTSYDDYGKPGASSSFFERRLIRLVPMYWIVTAIYVCWSFLSLSKAAKSYDAMHVIASFLYFPYAYPDGSIRPIVPQGWTLNYEMQFYVLFAISMLMRRSTGIVFVLSGLIVASLTGFVLRSLSGPGEIWTAVEFWTSPVLLLFGAGILIGLVYARLPEHLRPVIRQPLLVTLALLTAVTITFAAGWPHLRSEPQAYAVYSVACVVIVFICAFGAAPKGGALDRILTLTGDASYSIYLTHYLMINVVVRAFDRWHLNGHATVFIATALTFATLAGIALHLCVERPITRWLVGAARLRRSPVAWLPSRGNAT